MYVRVSGWTWKDLSERIRLEGQGRTGVQKIRPPARSSPLTPITGFWNPPPPSFLSSRLLSDKQGVDGLRQTVSTIINPVWICLRPNETMGLGAFLYNFCHCVKNRIAISDGDGGRSSLWRRLLPEKVVWSKGHRRKLLDRCQGRMHCNFAGMHNNPSYYSLSERYSYSALYMLNRSWASTPCTSLPRSRDCPPCPKCSITRRRRPPRWRRPRWCRCRSPLTRTRPEKTNSWKWSKTWTKP